jgi:tetratricopeptide (TPR) repeat protein
LKEGTPIERREAAMVLGAVGDARAVPDLAAALKEDDPGLVHAAETALWAIWSRSGNAGVDRMLQEGIAAVGRREYARALGLFSQVIAEAPDFAEGYNKRATTYYLMGEPTQAIPDCQAALARNPVHFGAVAGQGLCHGALGQLRAAARCFRRALSIHPRLIGVRENLAAAQQRLTAGNGGTGP